MSIYQDKQIKNYNVFLHIFLLLFLLTGVVFCIGQTAAAKKMLLSHDEAVVTSLIEQGVPETVIAKAITNTGSNAAGADFLVMLGMTENSEVRFLPFLYHFQKMTGYSLLIAVCFLSFLLLGGSFLFFRARERLYLQASSIIGDYINGDYSRHLPQTQEGTIYQIFASIEQLTTMLQAKNETEQQAKIFLKNMISDISHQLKTPLAALSMYQEIMENEPEHPDTIKEFSHKTGQAVRRMEQLIQSMLKITRLDAGSIVFEKSNCNIEELIQRSLEELTIRAEAEKKKILLSGSPEEMLVCDRNWTCEAFGNIIKNALDHTKPGDTIIISWERSPAMYRINISDNGNGIAQEDIYHIFKRFYRSRKSLDTPGIGLGLPLSKSIVEGQGGTISVQSTPHEKTVFTLSFPTHAS